MLAIEEMRESHTADNIKDDSIVDIIESWNISGKVMGISHDNASTNITNSVRNIQEECKM